MMSLEFFKPGRNGQSPCQLQHLFSIAGHIAGDIGSSDAGPDYCKINYGNVTLEKIPIVRRTGYVSVETTLQYEVFDGVDFCSKDSGSMVIYWKNDDKQYGAAIAGLAWPENDKAVFFSGKVLDL